MYPKSKHYITHDGNQYIYNKRPEFKSDAYANTLALPRASATKVQKNTTLTHRGTYGRQVHLCHHLSVGYLGEMIVDYLNGKTNMMYFWGNIACVINPEWRQIYYEQATPPKTIRAQR